MNRITNEQMMLQMAKVAALRSTCSRLHVGAVIADGAHPVSIGYNGAAKGEPHCNHSLDSNSPCTVSLHAESNALDFAKVPVVGMTMYITHAPCYQCSGRLINSDISKVVFLSHYRNTDGLDRLHEAGIEVDHGLVY